VGVLLKYAEKMEFEKFKMRAGLHGYDLDKAEDIKEGTTMDESVTTAQTMKADETIPFPFQDPKAYAHMSKEEKEELTQKMMKAHKGFVYQKGILVPKKPRAG
jgi:hypothetical protein